MSLQDVTVRFQTLPVLEQVQLQVEPGERIGLVGRNGAGKSTLLRLLAGVLPADQGNVIRQQGLSVAMLSQEVPRDLAGTVFDQVAQGLGEAANLLADFHRVSLRYATDHDPAIHAELVRLEGQLEAQGGWQIQDRVDRVLTRMELDPDAECAGLSAGMKRRVLLAQALVGEPDILLLDEPTNHLDLAAIQWLEDFLLRYDRTVIMVTHDRVFLRKLSTRIVEIDRGRVTSWNCDHPTYLERKQAALDAEEQQNALFDKRLAQEEVWIRTGVKARRTRNEGRVRALEKLRSVRQERRERSGEVRMQAVEADRSGRLVIEAKEATFGYLPQRPVVGDLTLSVMRGDKVGIVGSNGAGKTTLLRLLLGELQPQQGTVRQGTNLEVAYFDQLHATLDEESSALDNVTDGSDRITIGGQSRHAIGYLGDFLFSPEQARQAVKKLSGGERNRLLLARLFTKPANVLVLDEPTNDLDFETLELLEDLLVEYQGTVLLVSHDREFLNNVVTSTLFLDGQGQVKEYAGGYDEAIRQQQAAAAVVVETPVPAAQKSTTTNPPAKNSPETRPAAKRGKKLNFKEQQELEKLPNKIAELEARLQQLHDTLADPGFYRQPGDLIATTKENLTAVENELAKTYQRWESLESRRG